MNRKTLVALLGICLIPSLLFGQYYRMDVDLQNPGENRVIDRVFTGNTVGLDVGLFDGGVPFSITNWTVWFKYGDGQYATNDMQAIVGVTSSNRVVFNAVSNVFYSPNENYYFSIFGTNNAGRRATFARGRLIEEYDPAASEGIGTSSNGIYYHAVSWETITGDPESNTGLVAFVESHAGAEPLWTAASNRVLYVGDVAAVAYGTATNEAYRGDWGAAISNAAAAASNLAANAVPSTDATYTATVEKAATAWGWGDHSAAGYLTAEADAAALGVIGSTTNELLDLAGTRAMTGNLNMGRKSITNVSEFGLSGNRVTLHDDGSGGGKIGITRTAGGGTTERYIGYRRIDVGRFGTYTNVGDVVPSQEFAYLSDFTNYLDLAGTRAMTGSLNMNTNGIANVSYIIGQTGKGLFFDDNSLDFWDSLAIFNDGGTNVWQGRVNDTEASRIAALAAGSGFPLTEDGDLAGNSLTNGFFVGDGSGLTNLTGSITNISTGLTGNGSDDPLRINSTVVTNNQADVEFGEVGATLINVGDVIVNDDVLINGDLAVVGTSSNIQWTYVDIRTQVLGGTTTSYVDKTIYSTQVVFHTIITNIVETYYSTNIVSFVSTVGGNIDYGQAGSVVLPHLTDGAESNLVGSGTWVLTNATVQLAADATLGGVNIATGTPIYSTTYITDGFHVATPAIVTDGAAYLWAESNAWWTLDVTGANTLTAAVPWVISTNGLAVGEIPALAVKVALADSETNTWSWGSILTNSVTTPTAGSTNLFMLWWNGAAWVAY